MWYGDGAVVEGMVILARIIGSADLQGDFYGCYWREKILDKQKTG